MSSSDICVSARQRRRSEPSPALAGEGRVGAGRKNAGNAGVSLRAVFQAPPRRAPTPALPRASAGERGQQTIRPRSIALRKSGLVHF
jgi:hypothetical protein